MDDGGGQYGKVDRFAVAAVFEPGPDPDASNVEIIVQRPADSDFVKSASTMKGGQGPVPCFPVRM